MGFSENLKRIRNLRGLSQALLAQRAGLSKSSIANFENPGEATPNPSLLTLRALAKALNVGIDFLISEGGEFSERVTEQFLSDKLRDALSSFGNSLSPPGGGQSRAYQKIWTYLKQECDHHKSAHYILTPQIQYKTGIKALPEDLDTPLYEPESCYSIFRTLAFLNIEKLKDTVVDGRRHTIIRWSLKDYFLIPDTTFDVVLRENTWEDDDARFRIIDYHLSGEDCEENNSRLAINQGRWIFEKKGNGCYDIYFGFMIGFAKDSPLPPTLSQIALLVPVLGPFSQLFFENYVRELSSKYKSKRGRKK